jgi:dipeptidyl aminopeptidase/acylaminoacyl peptidase
VDVEDCANAARHLASEGMVDGERMAISGGSAGGYTTLATIAFTDVFSAGASHYGCDHSLLRAVRGSASSPSQWCVAASAI